MISSFILVLTIISTNTTQNITKFSTVDYDNPKAACESIKLEATNQLNSHHVRYEATCVKVPE